MVTTVFVIGTISSVRWQLFAQFTLTFALIFSSSSTSAREQKNVVTNALFMEGMLKKYMMELNMGVA